MQPRYTFTVAPALPPALEPLQALALNLYWSWHPEVTNLFKRLDWEGWEASGHSPGELLGTLKQEEIKAAAEDEGFLALQEAAWEHFKRYLENKATWFQKTSLNINLPENFYVAYLSAEFGLAACLPLYAGGLGILAGDHLKSASDLGVPLVGVSLLYREGYFRQRLDPNGWQQELYPPANLSRLPLKPVLWEDGSPLTIKLEYPGRPVTVRLWQVRVGRVNLYLLDPDCPENNREDRALAARLYGGDLETRIQQEILLGIGGVRALKALGIHPLIFHLNEGHSAFSPLEQIREKMQTYALTFAEAREVIRASNIFTTHTPVPAGIDLFPPWLMDKYFTSYYQEMGLSRADFLALGREDPLNQQEPFNMAVLALRLSAFANGVSRLHGKTSRRLWQGVWPEVPLPEIPITAITNGVHLPSWVGTEMGELYDHYLGPRWRENPTDQGIWEKGAQIPEAELWSAREKQRQRLITFVRRKLQDQLACRGAPPATVARAREVLHPGVLTVGFARRFAAYKRAYLLFRQPDRLAKILNDPECPVQVVLAGKAHPGDEVGKKFIQEIVKMAQQEEFRDRLVFLEDYEIELAKQLLQGADLWLNIPRRPQEASGTSGMKAILNGALHLSTLDGWWDEAYTPGAGWTLGQGEVYGDPGYQDEIEARLLYELLEKEIAPLFYARDEDGLPSSWLAQVKKALQTYPSYYNSHRLVQEYATRFYFPAARQTERLCQDNFARAKALVTYLTRLQRGWPGLNIKKVTAFPEKEIKAGDRVKIEAEVSLGSFEPEEIKVEIYHGPVDPQGEISEGEATPLTTWQPQGEGTYLFTGAISCRTSGLYGYACRLLPQHRDLLHPYLPGFIRWG